MRQSYLKNAALLTGADIVLRLAGMGLRIWLANALGVEGMGLYQLVLAVYSLFVTLATSGVSVAATRLMAEELSRSRAEARGMLVRLLGAALLLGSAALAAQFGLAGLAAKWWLGDVRATGALRVSAFGMPWMEAGVAQRGEPAGRADGPDRDHLVRPEPGRGAGRGRQMHRRPRGNGPE